MLSFVCLLFAVQTTFSVISPPQALYVNYKPTYEQHAVFERKHLPIVEVFKHDSTVKLPIFSWKLYNDHNDIETSRLYNISQKTYEIELYHEYYDEYNIIKRQLIWKSETLISNEHFCNLNDLKNIKNNNLKNILTDYKWEILSYRIRSELQHKDNKYPLITQWSNFGRFIITSSLLSDWNNASYIAQKTNNEFNIASPKFMTTFSIPSGKKVSSAIISIIGLGFYRFYINNNDILNLQNPPIFQIGGWTNTKHRVPYATFDIASYLYSNNELIIYLGEGYRNMTSYPPRDGPRSKNDPIDCITKVQLIIKYNDNTQNIIISNTQWQTASTKIKLSSIYNGETYDENTDINNIQNAITIIGPPGILYPTVQPYVSINKIIKPLDTIYSLPSRKSQIVDFGINNAGVVRINVGGLGLKKGDIINMKFAEVKQHPPYGAMNGELYYGNLRSAQQYDTFISNGNSSDNYIPFFTMHGFRYMEVWGYPRILTVNDIEKLQIYSNVKRRANWTSSDKKLNLVNERCINGQISNLKSVATDCDQRDERLGWMGDAALSSDTFCINFDMQSFITNYLKLITDAQDNNGAIPDIVPWVIGGGKPSDPNWGLAYPADVNVLYKYYGNVMIDIVKQYMNEPNYNLPYYIKDLQLRMPKNSDGSDNISKYPSSYGDWVPPPPAPKISNNFAGAFGYIETVRIVKGLATVIGNTSYVSYLDSLQKQLTNEFIAAFYKNGQYLNGLQTSYALSLHANIYSDDNMKNTLQTNLIKQITQDKNLITTGIIGAKFLLPVLHNMNQTNLSLSLIRGDGIPNSCETNIAENSNAMFRCSEGGIITNITFASFGTPTGTCNNFHISNCNSNNSMSVVKNLCLNKNSCIIPVTDDEFGDPCYGIKKHFDGQVICLGGNGNNNVTNASYPSWAFEQENYEEPASAIWELWDAQNEGPGMNSRNHHMYSSVSAYLNTDVSGIKNIKYNHWDIIIGHLVYNELKWSNFETDNGLIKYMWKWENEKKLNVRIVMPFGHFGYLRFRLNKQCLITSHDLEKKEWKLNGNNLIENKQSFIDKYDAKVINDGRLMIGSGYYNWLIFCV